jgi:hypothetical protein
VDAGTLRAVVTSSTQRQPSHSITTVQARSPQIPITHCCQRLLRCRWSGRPCSRAATTALAQHPLHITSASRGASPPVSRRFLPFSRCFPPVVNNNNNNNNSSNKNNNNSSSSNNNNSSNKNKNKNTNKNKNKNTNENKNNNNVNATTSAESEASAK